MANVYCDNSVSFSVNEEERETLQIAHNILEETRHNWFIQDDNVWENEDYCKIEESVKMLEELFKCSRIEL